MTDAVVRGRVREFKFRVERPESTFLGWTLGVPKKILGWALDAPREGKSLVDLSTDDGKVTVFSPTGHWTLGDRLFDGVLFSANPNDPRQVLQDQQITYRPFSKGYSVTIETGPWKGRVWGINDNGFYFHKKPA